jgi:hypothetical protein
MQHNGVRICTDSSPAFVDRLNFILAWRQKAEALIELPIAFAETAAAGDEWRTVRLTV